MFLKEGARVLRSPPWYNATAKFLKGTKGRGLLKYQRFLTPTFLNTIKNVDKKNAENLKEKRKN
jgi:hypothetical protein